MHIATHPTAEASAPKPFYRQLYFQVLAAIVLGVTVGHFWPEIGASLKPLGDAFIKLVKMIIAPVIFLTVTTGIAGMSRPEEGRPGRRQGVRSTSSPSRRWRSIVGLIVGNCHPAGRRAQHRSGDARSAPRSPTMPPRRMTPRSSASCWASSPTTVVGAFADGNILQVLFFSILFGIASPLVGERGKPVLDFLQALTSPMFKLVAILMKAAPIGAFGAMAFTIGKYGIGSVAQPRHAGRRPST